MAQPASDKHLLWKTGSPSQFLSGNLGRKTGGHMNRNQKIVGIICTLALVLMLIYPPYTTYRWPGFKFSMGYSFIWNPPSIPSNEFIQRLIPIGSKILFTQKPEIAVVLKNPVEEASIDFSTLFMQLLIVVSVRVLAIYALKDG
jgi:hypothetical protein